MKFKFLILLICLGNYLFGQYEYDLDIQYSYTQGELDIKSFTYNDSDFDISFNESFDGKEKECQVISMVYSEILDNLTLSNSCHGFYQDLRELLMQDKLKVMTDLLKSRIGIDCIPSEVITDIAMNKSTKNDFYCGIISYKTFSVQSRKSLLILLSYLDNAIWEQECLQKCAGE